MRLVMLLLLLSAAFAFCLTERVEYRVEGCSQMKAAAKEGYEFVNGTLTVFVMRNCCSEELLVEKNGNEYRILEIEKNGEVCRCNCLSKVYIKGVKSDFEVTFLDYLKEKRTLSPLSSGVSETEETEFCGWSVGASCRTDEDCIVSGCSKQVCAGKGEEIFTTCEWRDCYDAGKFGLKCGCFEGVCRWG